MKISCMFTFKHGIFHPECWNILLHKMKILHVPNRRRIRHVDVVVVSKYSCMWIGGGKRGYLGPGKELSGLKKGAVDPEHGTSMGISLHSCTKGYNPKKEDFLNTS
jgi:hypothetical protein